MLKVNNLTVGYGHHEVLRDVAFAVDGAQTVLVVGPNGAGKSTLLRTLAGVQQPLKGAVLIDSQDIFRLNDAKRSRLISIVTTDIASAGAFTVRQLVALGRQPHTGWLGRLSDEDKQVVDNMIERVGLSHKSEKFISDLSDGERQKAMIARALAQQTPLILLDEPTSFLDVAARIEVMTLIRDISKTGVTSLISSHDIASAMSVATKVLLVSTNGTARLYDVNDPQLPDCLTALFDSRNVVFDAVAGDFRPINFHKNS